MQETYVAMTDSIGMFRFILPGLVYLAPKTFRFR